MEGFVMGLVAAYRYYWRNYFNFTGRATRKGYWFVILWNFLIATPLFFAVVVGSLISAHHLSTITLMLILPFILGLLIFILATFIPNLSLNCRRFNDVGLTHWWYIGLYVSSLGLSIFTEFINASNFLQLLVSLLNFSMFLVTVLPSNQLSK